MYKNLLDNSNLLQKHDFESMYKYELSILENIKNKRQQTSRHAADNQFFIPAGRSFFANIHSNIFSFISSGIKLDPYLVEFGKIYETYFKRGLGFNDNRPHPVINKIFEQILCGKYIDIDGEEFIELADKRRIKLPYSSTGQQETLPLILILSILSSYNDFFAGQTFYIEEPEAHIFPVAQKQIVELITAVFNITKKSQFFITTHSPYILTSFNNLLQAGNIFYNTKDNSRKEAVKKIITEEKILKPGEVNAYYISPGGSAENIIDPETGLIYADKIDKVSDELAMKFDDLLDIAEDGE